MDIIKQTHINGYLLAFSLINHRADHGYTFEWKELDYHDDILTAYKLSFNLEIGEDLGDLRLIPIDHWKGKIGKVCDDWFFQVGYPFHKFDSYVNFDVNHCIQGFLKLLTDFFEGDPTVYKVECDPNFWYEGIWDDFIFYYDKNLFLLHFGVSD